MKKSSGSKTFLQQRNNIYVHLQTMMAEVNHLELHSVMLIKLRIYCNSKLQHLVYRKGIKGMGRTGVATSQNPGLSTRCLSDHADFMECE